jgi:hypothetical protein
MARIHVYRTYRWIDKDPIIGAVKTVVQDEKLKYSMVHDISGVSSTTLHNWFDGDTRKPQNATVTAVTSALGYVRHDRLNRDGTVIIGFEKARDLNWNKEIEKQADFMLQQAGKTKAGQQRKKRRRRAKKNGAGPP